jgi:hypothetical protein
MKKLVPSGRRVAQVATATATVATFAIIGGSMIETSPAYAADHRDGDFVKEAENIPSDINDVYAFIANDKVVLGMTVFPFAEATSEFSDATVYVFHVNKHPGFLAAPAGSTDVLCTFDTDQTAHCWIGDADYVEGDASAQEGITSVNGKAKLFAGLRADPFYFYLTGFVNTRNTVIGAVAGGLSLNGNGCPKVDAGTAGALRGALQGSTALNDFKNANGLAIVLEMDKSLFVDSTNQVLSVFGSTNVKQ